VESRAVLTPASAPQILIRGELTRSRDALKTAFGRRPPVAEEDNKNIVREIYTAFSSHRLDTVTAWIAEEAEWLDLPTGRAFRGPEGFAELARSWERAFPDVFVMLVKIAGCDGDTVTAEILRRGTHTGGPLETPLGAIEARGMCMDLRTCEVFEFKDGKVVSCRVYYDLAGLSRELETGVTLPAPG
jgi:steroid delta-isomerase-like uncharacterized protein